MIVLIQKQDEGGKFIRNWGPISLINLDGKVAFRALVVRIKKVLRNIIHVGHKDYV